MEKWNSRGRREHCVVTGDARSRILIRGGYFGRAGFCLLPPVSCLPYSYSTTPAFSSISTRSSASGMLSALMPEAAMISRTAR